MRTTLNLNDELMQQAAAVTHLKEKTAIIHAGLQALIAQFSRARLASLGGVDIKAKSAPRRRNNSK